MALSLAHRRSHRFIVDPTYDARRPSPAPDRVDGAPWLYAFGALEAWRMQVVRGNGFRDTTGAFHPGAFAGPATAVWFRRTWRGAVPRRLRLSLRAVGAVGVAVDWKRVFHHPGSDRPHRCDPTRFLKDGAEIRILVSTAGEPPALRILDGPLGDADGWEASTDGFHFAPVASFPATASGLPPHRVDEPTIDLAPVAAADGAADFGRELLARVLLPRGARPGLLTVGESPAEARHRPRLDHEQHLGLRDGASAAELALRHVRVDGVDPSRLRVRARFHPAQWRGAFACSDDRLGAIWMRSAYTLRLCMQDFLVDGLKRDRMPWVGDLALSVLANAYTFTDGGIVDRTLNALYGQGVEECHLNGIVDYSLWWPIAMRLQRDLSGDDANVRASQERLRRMQAALQARCDADGLLPARPGDWVFIDWVQLRKDGLSTAIQVLWSWALDALADLIADPALARGARVQAKRVAAALRHRAWTPQGYRMLVDRDSPPCRHATLLAVAAGLLPAAGRSAARRLLSGDAQPLVGTPYMGAFQADALARLGDAETALAQIRATWGGMLDLGATSFWEAFDPTHQGDQHWAYYGRPFAKSLCHAWGSGPAALLPQILLGIRPLERGWRRVAVQPQLCGLEWAAATVPTPLGDLQVEARAGRKVVVRAPRGVRIESGAF